MYMHVFAIKCWSAPESFTLVLYFRDRPERSGTEIISNFSGKERGSISFFPKGKESGSISFFKRSDNSLLKSAY